MNINRRELLLTGIAATLRAAGNSPSRLSMEAFIFQQYAYRQGKKLGNVLDEVIPMARAAGFRNIELNAEFFAPEIRTRTLNLVRSSKLSMPSVYVGGVLHEEAPAAETIQKAVEIGGVCKPFGCTAVVHNPSPKPKSAEKSDDELKLQAKLLNQMGQTLGQSGLALRVHHHTPEMINNAREWRYILHNTDPQHVQLCMDLDWVHQGDQDPLALLKEAGRRVGEIHVRNSKNKLWLESVEDGDVDYRAIARYLNTSKISPLVVAELAYAEKTEITRSLEEDLRRSRLYTEQIFGINA
ncbi:MAG: sugar phosphate isomerase/epimerase [Acidobacteriaceae bacterium]|nr:sugar phosphate isomerase/epimerase [Acidobacteriaceae bacterium]